MKTEKMVQFYVLSLFRSVNQEVHTQTDNFLQLRKGSLKPKQVAII
jgi:hypothetical protein